MNFISSLSCTFSRLHAGLIVLDIYVLRVVVVLVPGSSPELAGLSVYN